MMQLLDFFVGLMIQVGSYYKIKKNPIGWIISIVSIVYWSHRAMSLGLYSQCFWHAFSLCVAIYGYWSWREANAVYEESLKCKLCPMFKGFDCDFCNGCGKVFEVNDANDL